LGQLLDGEGGFNVGHDLSISLGSPQKR
jgi:hypothetical protein